MFRVSLPNHLRGVLILLPWLVWLCVVDFILSALLLLKPVFPAPVYHASSALAYSVWNWIQAIFTRFNGARIVVTTSSTLPPGESVIVIANHVAWSDFWLIQEVAKSNGMLEYCRWFAKQQLRWVPFLGWGLWTMGMPLVSRQWTRDRKEMERVFGGVVKRRWPIWLVAYSEGTRYSVKTHQNTTNWCQSQDPPIPVPRNTLYPRTRGFVTSVRELRSSSVRAVYDFTIAYSRDGRFMAAPEFWESIAVDVDKAGYKFYVHVDRFPLEDLPEDDEELASWLKERWMRKDERLERLKGNLNAGEIDVDLSD